MTQRPAIEFSAVVLDCPDAHALGDFYVRLLGWEVKWRDHDFVLIRPSGSEDASGLSFQSEKWYRPPVWPERDDEQHKMAHLDFRVNDLAAAEDHAIAQGATLAEHQASDELRVFLDPAGHPFCLFVE
jgi:catechol 2,3-dioxygenase-like lactoylglutathione lyase family enzyme